MHPFPDVVDVTRQVAGIVGMETLHPDAGASHATGGSGTLVVSGDLGVAFNSSLGMDRGDAIEPEFRFHLVDTTARLEGPDASIHVSIDQPVTGRHRCAVGHEGLVEDDGGVTV